jgi:Ni,Fe-hydrogenase III small subunit
MKRELRVIRDHGRQYIEDLRKQTVSDRFRGLPVISEGITLQEIESVSAMCPVKAIDSKSGAIDLGRCAFCNECALMLPERIRFLNDYRIAANKREDLVISPGRMDPLRLDESAVRKDIRRMFKKALKLRQVSAGGDNSCEMELAATGNVNFDFGRYGVEFVASPRHADGIVITGPLTENMSRALELTYQAVPSPKIIILVGSDAISGGIFDGSPALNRSFLSDHKTDLYVPGNPAHPITFINGVMDLLGL